MPCEVDGSGHGLHVASNHSKFDVGLAARTLDVGDEAELYNRAMTDFGAIGLPGL